MEAEKSQDLQSASWRPAELIVWLQLESEGLRTRRADVYILAWKLAGSKSKKSQCFSLSPGKDRYPNSSSQVRGNSLLPFSFCSDLPWVKWGPLILGQAICFTQSTNSNVNLIPKHRHTQNNVQPNFWASDCLDNLTIIRRVDDDLIEAATFGLREWIFEEEIF